MGGYLLEDTATDAIFRFDNENYAWHLESARLQTERRQAAAIAVPDNMVHCS